MTNYILCDRKPELVDEWQRIFASYATVKIKLGGFLETKCEAVVSPANSFGHMRGGLDYYLSMFFDKNTLGKSLGEILSDHSLRLDWTIERKVQEKINKEYAGELPVGKAIVVETGHVQIPRLISAPTMRTPQLIPPENVYKAMKAVIDISERAELRLVLVPGLGMGIGGVNPKSCAEQMEKAFTEVYLQ